MPDAVALVEARNALATVQSELATAHKQWERRRQKLGRRNDSVWQRL